MKYVLLLALMAVPAIQPAQCQVHAVEPTPVSATDAVCSQCHADIFRHYLATPMANASGLADDKFIPGHYLHVPSQVDYVVSREDGKPTLSWSEPQDPNLSGRFLLKYFLGSGHIGITYLYSINNYLLESPVAWYSGLQHYNMKPGLGPDTQLPLPLATQAECLRCHMSAVQPSDHDTLNRYSNLPFLHGGVTCEACHGDTAEHVKSAGKTSVVKLALLNANRRDSLCMSCHLEGDVSVARQGHSALDFQPGDDLSTFLAYYVYSGKDVTTRGVSEVEQFSQSMCKRMSGDRMSCTSCHDPHYTPTPELQAAFFRGKCLTCHNQPGFAAAHHSENSDCTSCHMPRNGAENIPHAAWTDHRILRRPDPAPSSANSIVSDTLVPIFSPNATSRDLGMAYYRALMNGNRAAEPKAWTLLNQNQAQFTNDKEALDALAVLTAVRGQQDEAARLFRRVLALDPQDLTASSDLGIILAKQGNLAEAESLLQSTFDRNQDIAGLAMNLAHVECAVGDATSARTTLHTILQYGPALEDARQMLQNLQQCNPGKQPVAHP